MLVSISCITSPQQILEEPPNHQQLLEEARRSLELVRERLELRKQLQLSAEVENVICCPGRSQDAGDFRSPRALSEQLWHLTVFPSVSFSIGYLFLLQKNLEDEYLG